MTIIKICGSKYTGRRKIVSSLYNLLNIDVLDVEEVMRTEPASKALNKIEDYIIEHKKSNFVINCDGTENFLDSMLNNLEVITIILTYEQEHIDELNIGDDTMTIEDLQEDFNKYSELYSSDGYMFNINKMQDIDILFAIIDIYNYHISNTIYDRNLDQE